MPPILSPPPHDRRAAALDLVEGLHLAHAACALQKLGLLPAMTRPAPAAALASAHRLDPEMLAGTLDFLAARTDLVTKSADGYASGPGYDAHARFVLDLYAGAFAPAAADLADSLRRPRSAAAKVDRIAQARAFDGRDHSDAGALPAILRQLGLDAVLDLGCGTAPVLRAMAAADPAFFGWGMDSNPAMCRTGRRLAKAAGLSRRVRIFEGDGRFPRRSMTAGDRARVRTILAGDFVNELFRGGGGAAVAWLRRVRRLFPNRVLVVADYYGRLGSPRPGAAPHTLLHDFVQLISGQGIPPDQAAGWKAIYEAAGCRLAHVVEDPATTRFVHFLRT